MNKVIHGAVRRDLERFRKALEGFTDGDQNRAVELSRAWANFDAQLTEHHEGEHEIAWPAMKAVGVSGPTIDSFDAEHEAMAADLASTRTAMATLSRTATRADADVAAAAMEKLQTTTVTHLDHEEAETESALIQHHGDAAVKEMGKKFSRRVGVSQAGTFFAWVQDGASPQDLAALRCARASRHPCWR
jgi:hemerythrin-like domain-containing protein